MYFWLCAIQHEKSSQISDEFSGKPQNLLVQGSALPNYFGMTITALRARGISSIEWSLCYPDLSLKECVLNKIEYSI